MQQSYPPVLMFFKSDVNEFPFPVHVTSVQNQLNTREMQQFGSGRVLEWWSCSVSFPLRLSLLACLDHPPWPRMYMYLFQNTFTVSVHTTVKAPVLVRSLKLSTVGRG